MSGTWVKVDAERVLYVHRGVNVILCTEQTFPNGAEFVLRLSDDAKAALRKELAAHPNGLTSTPITIQMDELEEVRKGEM